MLERSRSSKKVNIEFLLGRLGFVYNFQAEYDAGRHGEK